MGHLFKSLVIIKSIVAETTDRRVVERLLSGSGLRFEFRWLFSFVYAINARFKFLSLTHISMKPLKKKSENQQKNK